jgi:Ca-activated chloride channel family protein
MDMKRQLFTCILGLVFACSGWAQGGSAHKQLRSGDKDYQANEYSAAEEHYRRALIKEESDQGRYNLGNAIYQQERYEEAVKQYEDAAQSASEAVLQARAYHNLGNAHYQQQAYDQAVEAYKEALKRAPDDLQTKYNLALAQRELKLQQQRQQQEQEEKNGDEQNPSQEDQQESGEQDQQQQQQQQEQNKNDNQPRPAEAVQLSEEEIRQLLQIMEQEEQQVLEKMRRLEANPKRSEKDW